jgi:hypothetical protein
VTVDPVVHDETAAADDAALLALLTLLDWRADGEPSEALVLHAPTDDGAGSAAAAAVCVELELPPPNRDPKKFPIPEPDSAAAD